MPYAVLPNLTIVKILNFQNIKLVLNSIIHYLFYVTAFSATFKLLTTQLIFLATFLYQHVKERRERSSATAKAPRRVQSNKLALSRFRRQRYEEKMRLIGR